MLLRRPRHTALLAMVLLAVLLAGCGRSQRLNAPETSTSDVVGELRVDEADLAPDSRASTDAEDSNEHGVRWITAPATITEPGRYRLAADATIASGDGIVIQASGVRLSLGHRTLTGPGNKLGRAIVIEGGDDVLVHGGTIRRFGLGVAALGTRNARIRGLSIRGGDETTDPANGNPPQIGVMVVNSSHCVIAGNDVRGVNLGLFIRGGDSHENLLLGNSVSAGANGLLAICYNPAPTGGDAGPHGDLVAANRLSRFGTGVAMSAGSAGNRIRSNVIRYFDAPWSDLNGSNEFTGNRTVQLER